MALLVVQGGFLTAVPIGTRLPLLRILLGGGDGSIWFSGSCGCMYSAGLLGLVASAGAKPVPPCIAIWITLLADIAAGKQTQIALLPPTCRLCSGNLGTSMRFMLSEALVLHAAPGCMHASTC